MALPPISQFDAVHAEMLTWIKKGFIIKMEVKGHHSPFGPLLVLTNHHGRSKSALWTDEFNKCLNITPARERLVTLSPHGHEMEAKHHI